MLDWDLILGMTLYHISLGMVDILSAKILYQEGGKEVAQWAMLELGANFGPFSFMCFFILFNITIPKYCKTQID